MYSGPSQCIVSIQKEGSIGIQRVNFKEGKGTMYIDVSKIDKNRCKQTLASLPCFLAYR